MWDVDDTIVAIATARMPAIRGIVRLSGERTQETIAACFRGDVDRLNRSKSSSQVLSGSIFAGEALGEVPAEIYLWPTSRSYTRQPSAEVHTIGSLPVLDGILGSLSTAGARLARPGEFTLRAFLAGRLDLTQAEAVLGVIEARSQSELGVALQQLAGGLARPLHALREELLDLLAHLEAGLDFVEEDIQFITASDLGRQLTQIAVAIEVLQNQLGQRGESVSEPRVVLRGLPNTGKSSLFNALAGSDRSIVSPAAATTRDYVGERVVFAGRPLWLVDTAGIEEPHGTSDQLSDAAHRMTQSQTDQSVLELFCVDASRSLTAWEQQQLSIGTSLQRIVVFTKADQPQVSTLPEAAVLTSSLDGTGLAELQCAIVRQLDRVLTDESAVVATTAMRCAESLRLAAESISRGRSLLEQPSVEELVAAELRIALDQLGLVVGAVCTDDILDRVFSRFCIGK